MSSILKIKAPNWEPRKFKELGRGGEAVVYKLKPKTVAKIFLPPEALEFKDDPELQEAAKIRLKEMQKKLFAFPDDLPPEFVTPTGVLENDKGLIFGYTMPFIEGIGLDKLTRTDNQRPPAFTANLLIKLHDLVSQAHQRGVVIGDLNENNILVEEATGNPYLIDTDSTQFGFYLCRTFMPRFVAPELLEVIEIKKEKPKRKKRKKGGKENAEGEEEKKESVTVSGFRLIQPHSALTDWYSYLVMAMRLLTFTEPYGGVIAGKGLEERLPKRLTIFTPGVVYPSIAKPLRSLPRRILEVFFSCFQQGERFVPDRDTFSLEAITVPPDTIPKHEPAKPERRKKTNATKTRR